MLTRGHIAGWCIGVLFGCSIVINAEYSGPHMTIATPLANMMDATHTVFVCIGGGMFAGAFIGGLVSGGAAKKGAKWGAFIGGVILLIVVIGTIVEFIGLLISGSLKTAPIDVETVPVVIAVAVAYAIISYLIVANIGTVGRIIETLGSSIGYLFGLFSVLALALPYFGLIGWLIGGLPGLEFTGSIGAIGTLWAYISGNTRYLLVVILLSIPGVVIGLTIGNFFGQDNVGAGIGGVIALPLSFLVFKAFGAKDTLKVIARCVLTLLMGATIGCGSGFLIGVLASLFMGHNLDAESGFRSAIWTTLAGFFIGFIVAASWDHITSYFRTRRKNINYP